MSSGRARAGRGRGADEPAHPSSEEGEARPRRRRDPEGTRRALVRAAADVFNTVLYNETDSNKIARAAGYSPGAFYRHFPDKRALFLAVYDLWLEQEWAAVESRALLPTGREAKLGAILGAMVAHHVEWRVFRANLRMLVVSDAVVREHALARRREQLDRVTALRKTIGARPRSRAHHAVHLLAIERLCDAIADGELAALGIAEREARHAVGMLFVDYLESNDGAR